MGKPESHVRSSAKESAQTSVPHTDVNHPSLTFAYKESLSEKKADASTIHMLSNTPTPAENKVIIRAEDLAFTIHAPVLPTTAPQPQGLLDTSIRQFIDNADSFHPAEIARNASKWGITNFQEKAALTYLAITAQNKKQIYPYDRYLTNGSDFTSTVHTPVTNDSKECIVWCTNLYLGLNRNPQVIEAVKSQLSQYGTGCGTSAVSGGFSSKHKELETTIAEWLDKDDAILYPTGYTANLGAISSLATADDLIIFDKECHASIIDGIRLSGAPFRTFRNNDVNHLHAVLNKIDSSEYANIFVVTESVFGMTGEEAPIAEYCKLKKEFPFLLYVDEAHSFGIYGNEGQGYCHEKGCINDVDFIMGTLSKATASIGGFIACKKEFAAFLRISSNAYMFQASLPVADVITTIEAIKVIKSDPLIRTKLWHNTTYFRDNLIRIGFNVGHGTSPVVPVFIPQDDVLSEVCKFLYSRGIYTNWIAYPAVKKNMGRLRFIVSAGHTIDQIDRTLNALCQADRQLGII